MKSSKTLKNPETAEKRAARKAVEAKKGGGIGKGINHLTPKQEKFAQAVAAGSNLSDAYRAAYCVGENTTPDVVNVKASELMANGKVAVRVESLRAEDMATAVEGVVYEYEDAMIELDEAILFAKQCKSPGAAVAALNLKQKISGLHVEDRKNDRGPVSGMGADRVKAALEALSAFRKAKGTAENTTSSGVVPKIAV